MGAVERGNVEAPTPGRARDNPDATGLEERIFGGGSDRHASDLSTSKEARPSRETGTGTSPAKMADGSRDNPSTDVTDVEGQLDNAAQVMLPALAVETGSRASSLITGGVTSSTWVQNQGAFLRRTVTIGLPILLGVATFMVGARMKNVYVKQSAVGMAIPAADAVLNPILSPVESSLTGGGGNGGGNGTQGMGYGEFLVGERQRGMGDALPAGGDSAPAGMGIERSTDLVSEGGGNRFAQVERDR